MSELMLHGVLNMPIDLWCEDDLDKVQRHSRYVEASETIRTQQATIDRLTEQLKEQIESGYGLCKRISNPMAVCNCKYCVSDRSRALIAEIEAGK